MPKVLIVEDEAGLTMALRDNLEFEGYEVHAVADGQAAMEAALHASPDLILLDVMLPRKSGLEVCRELRAQGLSAPIILLTARGQEADKIAGLDLGADDYVTKPFSMLELMARVRAHLRRAAAQPSHDPEEYEFGGVYLDFRSQHATRGGEPVPLSAREFEILRYFIRHRGEVITREQLMHDVWRIRDYPLTRTIDNHIAKLRQKVDHADEPQFIVTLHRVGYKFLG